MSKTISKDEFVKIAQSLKGTYDDYGFCLYHLCKLEHILDKVYIYMTTKNVTSNEVDEYVYNLQGRPHPKLVIVDSEEERDRLIEQEKKNI